MSELLGAVVVLECSTNKLLDEVLSVGLLVSSAFEVGR